MLNKKRFKVAFLFCLIFLLLNSYQSFSQVKLITVNQLEKRFEKGKDTIFVVNFWATWCVPCVEELPNFEALSKEKHTLPLKVLFVSLDFKSKLQNTVIPFVNKHQIKNEVFVINEPNRQDFLEQIDKNWSGSIPATLFVNKNIKHFYEQTFTLEQLKQTLTRIY